MVSHKTYGICVVCLCVTLLIVGLLSIRPMPVVARTNLENLPKEIGGYKGVDDVFPESVNRELNTDTQLYRHYRSADGRQFDLYIGYYGTAKGGRTGHNPYACLPGAGWAIVERQKVVIPQIAHPVNYIRAKRDGVNTVMIHWYQTAGSTVVSSGFWQNMERFRGRLLRNRNDGAYVQVSSRVTDDSVEDAREKIQNYAERIIQLLPGFWPVEK